MHDVLLVAHAIVAADGSGYSLTAVGVTGDEANHLDDIHSLKAHGHHRGLLHRVPQCGEEWFIDQMGVVLSQKLVRQLQHLHAYDAESFLLKSAYHLAYQRSLHSTRLEQHKGSFHISFCSVAWPNALPRSPKRPQSYAKKRILQGLLPLFNLFNFTKSAFSGARKGVCRALQGGAQTAPSPS